MQTFHATLRTPTAILFDGEVESLKLKTDLGRMEILPNHATLVGTILYSRVFVKSAGDEKEFIIRQGSVSVDGSGSASVLSAEGHAEETLSIHDIDDYLRYITGVLHGDKPLNDYQKKFLEEQRYAFEETKKEKQQ